MTPAPIAVRRGRYLALFARYVGPERRRAGVLAVLLLASIGLQLVNPQLLRAFIDQATGGAEVASLVRIALAFMAIAFVTQILGALGQYVGEDLGWAATNALRADLALHCLRLDLSFHKTRTVGELIERVDGDVTALASFFSRFVINVVGNLVLLLGVLAAIAREDLRAGAAFAVFAIVALLLLGRLRNIAVGQWVRVREVAAQLYGSISEHLAGTEDVRSSGAGWHVLNALARAHRDWLQARERSMTRFGVVISATIVTFAVGHALAFAVGGVLWLYGAISVGTVYMLFHYTELLRRPIEQLRQELQDMQQALASVGRVEELLREPSRLPAGRGARLPSGAPSVEIDRVSFAYETTPVAGEDDAAAPPGAPVLRDVAFRLEPGRTLGVLGRTGSGKTTLARLLMRFYDPTGGAIRLGGVDLRDAALDEVRRHATLVTQDVQLFHATVRDNLTFFDRDIDDARIADVLERLGMGDWLRRLPAVAGASALDAELHAGALSAGEAQLVAFARVFLRDPGLVILDEASSRLDPATERHIERAIDTLLEGRTAIVIAHRLATLDRCDEVLILEQGRVVEHGAREALAREPGSRFAGLLRSGLDQVMA